ncbi:MAG TPA: acyl-ACP desaturase [Acidimicrobiales bacterium]|nr:acyl-ACP desaturase [Acidimicrobiales bacterium]
MNEIDLLHELAPEAERLLERHLAASKEWFPHELVPWDEVIKHDPRGEYDPDHRPIPEPVKRALFVNLLTEDNLPYYTTEITRLFGIDHAWGAWNRRWTAEEGRHAIVIRDFLTVTGALDPKVMERGRMQHAEFGFHHPISGAADGFVYVALQELATRISHWNTGKLMEDKAGNDVMKRVAADENMHYLFYKDVTTAAVALDPSAMVLAMERQVKDFQMPGAGIDDFTNHAKAIAEAGIYNLHIHHDQILAPVILRSWKLEAIEGLSPEAEAARERLVKRMARIEKVANSQEARRQERLAAARSSSAA